MMKTRTLAPVLAILMLIALPEIVAACPVCFDQDDEARIAFIATTGLLTFLPLAMVGGVLYWLRQRFLGQTADDLVSDEG
jgi:hypothetical protein